MSLESDPYPSINMNAAMSSAYSFESADFLDEVLLAEDERLYPLNPISEPPPTWRLSAAIRSTWELPDDNTTLPIEPVTSHSHNHSVSHCPRILRMTYGCKKVP